MRMQTKATSNESAMIRRFAKHVQRFIKDIEWNGYDCELDYDWDEEPEEEYYPACPSCGGQMYHHDGCKLVALRAEATAVLKMVTPTKGVRK